MVGIASLAALLGLAALVTSSGTWAMAAGVAAVVTAGVGWRATAGPVVQSTAEAADRGAAYGAESPPGVDPASVDEARVPPPRAGTELPSGLVDEATLAAMLRSRLAVARRALRPLSVAFVEVDEVDGLPETDAAVGIRCTVREADVAGRRDDGLYVLVLDETGEDGAVWTCERLRRTLFADRPGRGFRAGVASYPGHGLDAADLEAKAAEALMIARQWHVDRIEVAEAT